MLPAEICLSRCVSKYSPPASKKISKQQGKTQPFSRQHYEDYVINPGTAMQQ